MRIVNAKTAKDREAIAQWVGKRIGFVGEIGFGSSTGMFVVSRSGAPLAGVIFHDWQPALGTLAFSIAADSPKWATRRMVGTLLSYPFEEVKVEKLWTATPMSNERALRLVKGVGFTREAVLGRHFGQYGHAVISRMYKEDYHRLYGDARGQAQTANAA